MSSLLNLKKHAATFSEEDVFSTEMLHTLKKCVCVCVYIYIYYIYIYTHIHVHMKVMLATQHYISVSGIVRCQVAGSMFLKWKKFLNLIQTKKMKLQVSFTKHKSSFMTLSASAIGPTATLQNSNPYLKKRKENININCWKWVTLMESVGGKNLNIFEQFSNSVLSQPLAAVTSYRPNTEDYDVIASQHGKTVGSHWACDYTMAADHNMLWI